MEVLVSFEPKADRRGFSCTQKKTAQWLKVEDGTWRNGWLEAADSGERWYSDVISTHKDDDLGVEARSFDLLTGQELDCAKESTECRHPPYQLCWSDAICIVTRFAWITSVAIANGSRLGLSIFDTTVTTTIQSLYSVSIVVTNFSIVWLLVKWAIALSAIRRGTLHTESVRTVGIGCLANSRSFELLPLVLLPRLRNPLTSFFTAGIYFEGDQMPLAESWFKIYPGITEVVLFYFSVLNLIANSPVDA